MAVSLSMEQCCGVKAYVGKNQAYHCVPDGIRMLVVYDGR